MLDQDLTLSLIKATVEIDQPIGDGRRVVGTGFLVLVPHKGGSPEVVLVTAAHVFEKMPGPNVRIGWRIEQSKGNWVYKPSTMAIRSKDGPLWVSHPSQDVAVIPVTLPENVLINVIAETQLANEKTFDKFHISPGDEVMTLGYPYGLSANDQGFPVLRSGKVSSYPLTPSKSFPTFLIDLTAVAGNSGGPVFMTESDPSKPQDHDKTQLVITGILTKQVEMDNQRLELGLVTHAVFIRQTLEILAKKQGYSAPSGAEIAPNQIIRTPDKNTSSPDTVKTDLGSAKP